MIDLRKQERVIVINPRIQDLADKYKLNIVEVYSAVKRINFDAYYLCIHTIDCFNAVGFSVVDGPGILRLMQADEDCAIVTDMPFITPKDAFIWLKKNVKPQDIFESKSEDDMVDLRKKEVNKNDIGNPYAKDGVAYVLIYKGSEEDANKLSNALHKKPSVKNGNSWYFKYMSDRDAYSALDNNESKFKGLSYKQIKNDDWKKIKNANDLKKENIEETDMIDLRENNTSKNEEAKEYYCIIHTGWKNSIKDLGRNPSLVVGNKAYFKYNSETGAKGTYEDYKDKIKNLSYKVIGADEWEKLKSDADTDLDTNINLGEETEIKFVNKGEKFKSEKGDEVEIVDIEKKDDKSTVTYKLGDEEKKGDIEDVIKMLNGAEYKKVNDKKDEATAKKFVIYCTSKNKTFTGYVGDNDNYANLKDLISAEGKDVFFDSEKKAQDFIDSDPVLQGHIESGDAKYTVKDVTNEVEESCKEESAEDDSVEITLTEEFHVPGTDVILEAGDVIRIIPRKDD